MYLRYRCPLRLNGYKQQESITGCISKTGGPKTLLYDSTETFNSERVVYSHSARVMGCLHDPENFQQIFSKCIQNTRAYAGRLLVVCWIV